MRYSLGESDAQSDIRRKGIKHRADKSIGILNGLGAVVLGKSIYPTLDIVICQSAQFNVLNISIIVFLRPAVLPYCGWR